MMRALGLLIPVARTRIRFIAIAIRRPAARRQTSPAGKPPLTAGSTGIYAEFVIAIADLGHCRYSALACLACLAYLACRVCSIGSNVAKYSIRSR